MMKAILAAVLSVLITRNGIRDRNVQFAILLVSVVLLLRKLLRPRYGESCRDRLGRLALALPPVRKEYEKEYLKQLHEGQEKLQEKWKVFGFLHEEMPEHGYEVEDLHRLVDFWSAKVSAPLSQRQISGTIYSRSFVSGSDEELESLELKPRTEPRDLSNVSQLDSFAVELKELYTHGFRESYLWNSLHANEFGIGDFLSYQVVQMVSSMYGGNKKDTMGFVTSGGTESIMLAIRCYRNWGMEYRGLKPGEAVVICCTSAHAAFVKAGMAYHVKVVLAPTNPDGTAIMTEVRALVRKYGRRVVCIVGSAPAYAIGVCDSIDRLACIARGAGCGLHVDSCLGGFVVNNLDQVPTNFLSTAGVTSLSADTHKNGWAPKGSSVLVTKAMPHSSFGKVNLAYYSVYAIPGWSGGVYGTPRDPGSCPVVNVLHAYLAMLSFGKSGYKTLAEKILETCQDIAQIVEKFDRVELCAKPQVNVVAFKFNRNTQKAWGKGAIYAFAHLLEKHGFTLNALKDDQVHFCITGRFAGDKEAVARFEKAFTKAMEETTELAQEVQAGKCKFPGDAGLYGQLNAAMEPNREELGIKKYIENYLLGSIGVIDAVRAYFMSTFNPYQ